LWTHAVNWRILQFITHYELWGILEHPSNCSSWSASKGRSNLIVAYFKTTVTFTWLQNYY